MKNSELREEINKIADELFPNLQLEFVSNMQQMDIFCAYIRIATPILIDKKGIIHNLPNKSAIRGLLKRRTIDALEKTKDYLQDYLDTLDVEPKTSGMIEIPKMLFRGRKIYIEGQNSKDDQIAIKKFIDFLEHLTGIDFRREL